MQSPKLFTPKINPKYDNTPSSFISKNELKIENRPLASGGYADIYLGFWNEKEVAVKRLKMERRIEKNIECFKNEIQIALQMNHPNVIAAYGCTSFEDSYNLELIMERMQFSLFDFLVKKNKKPLGSSALTHSIMYQVFSGINYVHSQGIAHCDIKPENFLIGYDCSELNVKLCDFGFAVKVSDRFIYRLRCGTKRYHAPEIILGGRYSYESDIFAAGCVFQSTLTRSMCYSGSDDIEVDANIVQGKRVLLGSNTDPLYQQIIEECSRENPENRPSAEEVVNHLKFR